MINHVTRHEYQGQNAANLMALGFDETDEFVTFKQAIKLPGLNGKVLKGIKSKATLVRYSRVEKVQDEKGKQTPKPIYFAVFHILDVLARRPKEI